MKSRDKIREIGRSFKDLDGQAAFYVRRSRGRSTGFKEKCRGRRFFRDGRKKPRSELRGSHGTERRPILLAEQERGTFGCGQQALRRRAVSRRIHGSCESPARFKYFPDRMSGLRQDNEKGRRDCPCGPNSCGQKAQQPPCTSPKPKSVLRAPGPSGSTVARSAPRMAPADPRPAAICRAARAVTMGAAKDVPLT